MLLNTKALDLIIRVKGNSDDQYNILSIMLRTMKYGQCILIVEGSVYRLEVEKSCYITPK